VTVRFAETELRILFHSAADPHLNFAPLKPCCRPDTAAAFASERTRSSRMSQDSRNQGRGRRGANPLPWFVAIGASGGQGLNDIKDLLAVLPPNLDAVVMVVLHRPWESPSYLRNILDRATAMNVQIASQGDQLDVGTVYVGEPSDHLTLAARCLGTVTSDPTKLHRNRTIDLLFKSIAENGGPRTIGVVLSGSLDDGSRGLAAMHDAGGLTMVMRPGQDSTGGMPENAIHFDGPIDEIGSAEEIAAAIIRTVSRQLTTEMTVS